MKWNTAAALRSLYFLEVPASFPKIAGHWPGGCQSPCGQIACFNSDTVWQDRQQQPKILAKDDKYPGIMEYPWRDEERG